MALEKSVLNVDKVRELLITEYGLHLIGLHPLSLGTANCFKVCCNEGMYFFKEYPGSFTVPMVEKEVRLVEYLFSKGYPVARFIDTLNGSCCILFSSHVIGVQEFVEGKTYLNDLPHPLLKESAKYLGILHFLLKDYPMESDMDEKWVESYSPKTAAERYDRLLDTLEESRSDPNYHRIREDLLFKRELSGQIEDMKTYYTGITYTPSHGDYTACQFICGEGSVKAVIDFSSAAALPAVWEIMRSYIQSCGACRGGTAFDIEDFVLYVKEYMKYSELTKRDLEAMPYVYLFQLARSAYGYKEYLITKTENRDALLDFAIWRTEICREIYRQAPGISEALMQHLTKINET